MMIDPMIDSIKSFSAGGVVVHDDEILLVCENGNFWGFPKGRIESGETASQAARREIMKETGLQECTLIRKIGSYTRHPFTLQNQLDTSELKTITLFLFQARTKNLVAPLEPHTEGAWVAKDAVQKLLTHPQDKSFYESIKEVL